MQRAGHVQFAETLHLSGLPYFLQTSPACALLPLAPDQYFTIVAGEDAWFENLV